MDHVLQRNRPTLAPRLYPPCFVVSAWFPPLRPFFPFFLLSFCLLVCGSFLSQKVEKTAQNHGFPATRVAFNPHDHGFFTTSGAMHLRLWYSSSDNVLKPHGILPQAKEQARPSWYILLVYTQCYLIVFVHTRKERKCLVYAFHEKSYLVVFFFSCAKWYLLVRQNVLRRQRASLARRVSQQGW